MTDNLIKTIAKSIHERGKAQGWKPGTATADKLNFEAWAGAAIGIGALEGEHGENAQWVLRVLSMLIAPRGYAETISMATKED